LRYDSLGPLPKTTYPRSSLHLESAAWVPDCTTTYCPKLAPRTASSGSQLFHTRKLINTVQYIASRRSAGKRAICTTAKMDSGVLFLTCLTTYLTAAQSISNGVSPKCIDSTENHPIQRSAVVIYNLGYNQLLSRLLSVCARRARQTATKKTSWLRGQCLHSGFQGCIKNVASQVAKMFLIKTIHSCFHMFSGRS
jgi:hypothetical protein